MLASHESELELALAQGLLAPGEVDVLREEARRLRRRPLDLLAERGRIDATALDSLRRRLPVPNLAGGADPEATTTPGECLTDVPTRLGGTPGVDPEATVETPFAAAPPPHGVLGFPVRDWDRYEPVRLLGQGGMGTVFLAREVRLRRQVALKFVRGNNPRHTARLLIEARAQARVSHDRVCKVYEVGEVQGQVYIAMQYIDGEPLSVAARDLSFEQRALAIRDAADGVHEAHRAGIIHRDIKPGNIMIERGEDGRLRTYVMDFGLARDRDEGQTETGAVMGTPHYMAPEQARGEVERLDRRADVYSLGAALYQVLSGQPPIPGANNLEVLSNIPSVEPRPMRELDQDVPPDLEAITRKCLEKERSARYDSARALVEDLDRFLNGEPVQASRAGAWYRLRKRVRKHRRLVVAAATGLLLLGIALGWGLQTRLQAAERERLARRFSERVEQVEAMARYSALSRLHDTRSDRAKILARMREIEAEVGAAGRLAEGPGAYAIGRGYLALGDDPKARASLEKAWARGFREPRAAYGLALVLGHLYQRELLEAERIRNDARRARRKTEIEAQYRAPALDYLRQSAGADVPSQEYVAALVAYYEGRLDEALGHLDAIGETLPWFYEAPELRGNVLLARGILAFRAGDRERARADLEAARRAYAVACAVAESAPGVWEAAGALEYQALVMELYGEGDVKPRFEHGALAASRALTALPDNTDALVLSAGLHRRMAEDISQHGGKAEEFLAKAILDASTAASAPSRPLPARLELARGHSQWGQYLQEQNKDPREQLRKAEEILDGLRPEETDYDTQLQGGLVAQTWADYEEQIGQDPETQRTRAIEAYLAATALDERQLAAWVNLGACYFARATRPRAPAADADLAKARNALDRARALDRGHMVPYFYGGLVAARMAERARARGLDARPDLESALGLYRDGIAVNPRSPHLHNGAGIVLLELAAEAWNRGGDPEPLIREALATFERAIEAAPGQGFGHHNVCEAWTRLAGYRREAGVDPEPLVQKAVDAQKIALQGMGEHAAAWANLAAAHLVAAEFEVGAGRDPTPRVTEASAAANRALEKNRADPPSQLALARAMAVRARWQKQDGSPAAAEFGKTVVAFQAAVDLAPERQDYRVALGHACREWGLALINEGQDPDPALRRGLGIAEALLQERPAWPDALALRGCLWLARAEVEKGPDARRTSARRALDDLTQSLAGNPNLEPGWRKHVAAARLIVEVR